MNDSTQKSIIRFTLLLLLLSTIPYAAATDGVIEHRLRVKLQPEQGRIQVEDEIRFPDHDADRSSEQLLLHAGLQPQVISPGAELELIEKVDGAVPLERYRLKRAPGTPRVSLKYGGIIQHPLSRFSTSLGRSREQTPGSISAEGIFLSAGSGWYPRFGDHLQRFNLQIVLPSGWLAVSQGDGPIITHGNGNTKLVWKESQPQDDIYLIAGRYTLYRQRTDAAEAQVYLRSNNPQLAQRYLAATEKYLQLYSRLIGPYPYAKFALVENFWETGYGMPSFTLLGPRVIQLPFILHSSYPHEILHNWWGNGVYVDYAGGNWSEGLTSYLADHLIQEQRGRGDNYRRSALQRYEHFVSSEQDFPLQSFRSRHSGASQSVGYDKGLMVFHMLRRRIGDQAFLAGLQRFYQDNRFRVAGIKALEAAFQSVSNQDLGGFFHQWWTRKGAPRIELDELKLNQVAAGYEVTARLRQVQTEPPFPLQVPITLEFANARPALETTLRMDGREALLQWTVSDPPVRLSVDPHFDLFRRLDPLETPPTLSALLGEARGLMVLPAAADPAMGKAYRALASRWALAYPGLRLIRDDQVTRLPEDQPLWLLGWNNRFRNIFAQTLTATGTRLTGDKVILNGETYTRPKSSIVLTSRRGDKQLQPLAWIGAESAAAVSGLAHKLPHYGKYSYLAFAGTAPNIQLKGQWQVSDSPLRVSIGEEAPDSRHPTRQPLSALVE